MSGVQVSESNNTSAIVSHHRKPQHPARSRMSGAVAAMSITSKKRQWPGGQAGEEEDEEEGDLALQQATSARGPSQLGAPLESSDSVSACLTDIISGILKQTETAMEDLLPMIGEIDGCALDIKEQLSQKRDMAMDRRATLEQTRERFQQTVSSVLEMLNLTAPSILEPGLRDETGA